MADGIEWTLDTTVLDALIASSPTQLDALLRGAAVEIVGDIVLSFNTSPAGRTYKRGKVLHTASQAGYPPNVDLGTLRASMKQQKIGHLHYQVSDGVEYGMYLEVGTEKMAARPFVKPVFNKWGSGGQFEAFAKDFLGDKF